MKLGKLIVTMAGIIGSLCLIYVAYLFTVAACGERQLGLSLFFGVSAVISYALALVGLIGTPVIAKDVIRWFDD